MPDSPIRPDNARAAMNWPSTTLLGRDPFFTAVDKALGRDNGTLPEIDQSGVITFPPDPAPSPTSSDRMGIGPNGPESNVIRGLNCPILGNHQIRGKVDSALAWLDSMGLTAFTSRVAIDRAALLMVKEEFEAAAAREKVVTTERNNAEEEVHRLRSGQIKPKEPVPDRFITPDPASSWSDRLVENLPVGASVRIEACEYVVTIPR